MHDADMEATLQVRLDGGRVMACVGHRHLGATQGNATFIVDHAFDGRAAITGT